MNLVATPTRLRTLRAIADGKVARYGDDRTYEDAWKDVTHSVFLLEKAGWVELGDEVFPGKRKWRLTDDGKAVLDASVR